MADASGRLHRSRPGLWGVRRLARELVQASSRQSDLPDHWSERARALIVARTALRLIRQRPIVTALAGHLRPSGTRFGTTAAKFKLWAALGQARRSIPQRPGPENWELISSLAATHAWRMTRHRHQFNPLTPTPRLHDRATLTKALRQQQPQRIAFWHHHDRLGELPRSWLAVLSQLRQQNWLVVVSSSFLNPQALNDLKRHDLLPCRRDNIGLCLGAYKDFCLLLHDLELQPQALLLSNDSTLPLCPDGLMEALDDFAGQAEYATTALLGGFTDSVERGAYHLQSYWLEANGPLLAAPIWHQFWRRMPIAGDKDSLIDAGEIGLSKVLLQAGVDLRARFSLLRGLLHEPAMAQDLKRAGIRTPLELNQSLQAWRSLLVRGFPLVKKRVLFEEADNNPAPPALTELIGALPPGLGTEALSLLEDDLQALLRSRHAGSDRGLMDDQGQRDDHEPLAQGR